MLDLQAFVAGLKDHVLDHGFHIYDERHYIETYSGEQVWYIGLHLENSCDGPIAVELILTASTRALLKFEDALAEPDDEESSDALNEEMAARIVVPLTLEVSASPLATAPDLLVLATEVAARSHPAVPMKPTLTSRVELLDEGEEYCLHITGKVWVPLFGIYQGDELKEVCAVLDSGRAVCRHLCEEIDSWMG